MKTNGFIKLHRSILDWRWYEDANTFRVFLHLLLKAAVFDYEYGKTKIKRGEVLTTYDELALTLKLSVQNIRTAISHLKSTGEITSRQCSKFQVISILRYNDYQVSSTDKLTGNQQAANRQLTGSQQPYNKKNIKNNKNNKNIYNNACTRERENSFPTPKPTKFSNFEQDSNIDYKEFEMKALRERMERRKKNAEETNPQL